MIRKEIQRAFLFWPAAASAAVIAASSVSLLWSPDSRSGDAPWSRRPITLSMERDSHHRSIAPTTHLVGDAYPTDRSERGKRGPRCPGRLTEHWSDAMPQPMSGQIAPLLAAPVIDPAAELAGYSGQLTHNVLTRSLTLPATMAPSQLSPGIAEPVQPSNLGIFEFARPTLAAMGNASRDGLMAIGNSSLLRRYVSSAANGTKSNSLAVDETSSLIPLSVRVLARPSDLTPSTSAWPIPKQLRLDLATLASRGQQFASIPTDAPERGEFASLLRREASAVVMGRWADQVDSKLGQLQSLASLSDPTAGTLIRDLATLAEAGLQLAEKVPVRDQQIRWLQTAHALSRRVSVWGSIWQLTQESESPNSSQSLTSLSLHNNADGVSVASLVDSVRKDLVETGDVQGWNKFLLLDEITKVSAQSNYDERAVVAQRFLSRLSYHGLDSVHARWLNRDSVDQLVDAVRSWTMTPVDYAALLEDLERQESDSIDLASLKITESFQSLRFSDTLSLARVAKSIDVNYRNANIRTAIAVELIDRFIPSVPERTAPIATNILGASVRGQSHTQSDLGLQLVPDSDEWRINVLTSGSVVSQTRGTQSNVTLHTTGRSHFTASTPIKIDTQGYKIGDTHVDVRGGNQLRGIDTQVDGWPLLGSLVRSIATSRYEDSRGAAQRIADGRVASEVKEELSSQLQTRSLMAQQRIDDLVVGPLAQLQLNPRIIDLETTSERLIARYRIAGEWQLAAHTPRPRASSDAWMSVQIHQSALNNTLETILPRGQSQTFAELFEHTVSLFGKPDKSLPADVPGDVEIQFADTRPITVEIEDDRLWLTFRIVSLSQPGSARLTRFIVRAAYRPEVSGLDAHLVRDGHLRISGPGMSMRQRLPVRAIFTKVLDENRPLPITVPRLQNHPAMAGLMVTQMELRDGWLAIAFGPEQSIAPESEVQVARLAQ